MQYKVAAIQLVCSTFSFVIVSRDVVAFEVKVVVS